jgi:hypothetical protein
VFQISASINNGTWDKGMTPKINGAKTLKAETLRMCQPMEYRSIARIFKGSQASNVCPPGTSSMQMKIKTTFISKATQFRKSTAFW